jgi:CubicO group peptidase (beta-lactamase class C family)
MFDHVTFVVDDEQISELETKAASLTSMPADFVSKVQKLKGKYDDADAYNQALVKAFGRHWQINPLLMDLAKQRPGKVIAWYADGYLGQYLVIVPGANLVAVRMISGHSDYNPKTDSFDNFRQLVIKLVTPANLLETKK